MAKSKPYLSGGRRFATLQEACDYSSRYFKKTGVLVAVEKKA